MNYGLWVMTTHQRGHISAGSSTAAKAPSGGGNKADGEGDGVGYWGVREMLYFFA